MAQPRLLYLLHAYHNRAGTEEHTKALIQALSQTFQISAVFPNSDQIVLRQGDKEESFPGEPFIWPATPYPLGRIELSLKAILERTKPEIIHIQHIFNWPLGVIDYLANYASNSGAKLLMSFHDYYLITPLFTMQGASNPAESFTKEYSEKIFGADITPYLRQRREVLSRSLTKIPKKIVPSNHLAGVLRAIFPDDYRVIEHGIAPYAQAVTKYNGPGLRFGYVGSLIPQKGWQTLVRAFPAINKEFPQAELHLFGGGHNYQGPPLPGVTFRGVYDQADLPRICSEFHVGIIPSEFQETFCLVLSELWQAQLPILVADIGQLGERVIDGVNGKKFISGNIHSLQENLRYFLQTEEWKSWEIPQVRSLTAMTEEYEQLYLQYLEFGDSH